MASFHDFGLVCQAIGQTQSRTQMVALVGEFLAGLSPEETEAAARFLIGRALAQGEEQRLNVSGRAVWRVVAELTGAQDEAEEIFSAAADFGEAVELAMRSRAGAGEGALSIIEVDRRIREIAAIEGRNSRRRKLEALGDLFARLSALEAKYAAKILIGEMRHGMSEGLMVEAIARMAERPVGEVRRAHMLEPDIGRLARRLRAGESPAGAHPEGGAPAGVTPDEGVKPLRPMLAAAARDVAEAFEILSGAFALEHKLDGARVQIHRRGGRVRIFSRRLNEITASLPEVVEATERLGAREAILDGEVIAVGEDLRPLAFQEVMRRFGRIRDVARHRSEQPVRLFVFDVMGIDGALVIDLPYAERWELLGKLAEMGGLETVRRIVPGSLAEAERFYAEALAAGYEGVMAKALSSAYTPGVRGHGWLKVKRAKTLDLVIVAADWGYGRRHGWLSNYHLAARADGRFVEVGKTFKGLTDEEFAALTERLLALRTDEGGGTVVVRPEVVVEVAYSDIQRSPQYESGMALRFARITRIRDDKAPGEADTIETLALEFERQAVRPRRERRSGAVGESD